MKEIGNSCEAWDWSYWIKHKKQVVALLGKKQKLKKISWKNTEWRFYPNIHMLKISRFYSNVQVNTTQEKYRDVNICFVYLCAVHDVWD